MKESEMAIPHLFMCPISLDLLRDPVTLCTGQTYDRSSIEEWLAAGNQTCPVTMQKLHDPSMVPNHTLRHLIDQWLRMGACPLNPNCHDQLSHDPSSLAALKHNLRSHCSSLETKLQTLQAIRVLSEETPSWNGCLIQLGFFPLILELVFRHPLAELSQENMRFEEQALVCAVKLLPYANLGDLNMFNEESKLACFLRVFSQGTISTKTSLCELIEAISSSPETRALCSELGGSRRLLQELVALLRSNGEASAAAIRTLSALCSLGCNRDNLVRENIVDALIARILFDQMHKRQLVAPGAVALLELLLELESAKQALINHPDGVNALVKMVFRVSDHDASESAVNSLVLVCFDSAKAREEALGAGVLIQLLLLLQSQCSGTSKKKARMLIKLLSS